jgi:hypothetical protein
MANIVYNRLEIKGNSSRVLEGMKGKNGIMDFNKVIPMPRELNDNYGFKTKDWAMENWDVKWNAEKAKYIGGGIIFNTPWKPPLKVIEEMSKKFRVNIKITWADEEKAHGTGEAEYSYGVCINKTEFIDVSREAKKAYRYARALLF